MASTEITVYDKVLKHLYDDTETALRYLTPTEVEIKKRVMLCVNMVMDEPMIRDFSLVEFLKNGCGGICSSIGTSQAYRDIAAVRKIVGNIQLSSKSWYRYMVIEGAKEAFEIGRTNNDSKGMSSAIDKIGKYTRADKEDDPYDYSEMTPPSFEPTDDISVLEGFEKIDNLEQKRKEFRARFKSKLQNTAEDAITGTNSETENSK